MKKRRHDNWKKEIHIWNTDMPDDVSEYLAIMAITGGMMGFDMYKRCQEIVDKYPEWFPWEHKYKSIPKEVHEAYEAEKHPPVEYPISGGKGLIAMIREHGNTEPMRPTYKTLREIFIDEVRRIEKDHIERLEKRKADEALWDKYYKKYGLEYRE